MLARWRSWPMRKRRNDYQPITERLQSVSLESHLRLRDRWSDRIHVDMSQDEERMAWNIDNIKLSFASLTSRKVTKTDVFPVKTPVWDFKVWQTILVPAKRCARGFKRCDKLFIIALCFNICRCSCSQYSYQSWFDILSILSFHATQYITTTLLQKKARRDSQNQNYPQGRLLYNLESKWLDFDGKWFFGVVGVEFKL